MQKEKKEIIYAVITILVIPLLILANTLFMVRSVKKTFSAGFSEKADVLNTVMIESLRNDIVQNNGGILNQKLENLHNQQPVLSRLQVLSEKDGKITTIAKSSDASQQLSSSDSMAAKIVYEKRFPVARLTNVYNQNSYTSAWVVTTPLMDETNKKVLAVLNSTILPGETENILNKNLYMSMIFVVISIIVIFLLLFRHFRFAEYGRLLARQREINQTMSNFLSVATHELKAPTTIIKGYIANTLEDEQNPVPDSAKEQLKIAMAQTDRLNHLVKDLLNVSRIEQGRIEYNISSFRLDEVIGPVVKNYKIAAQEKNITIANNLSPDILVRADQDRVQEIFTNLVDNAIKYSMQGAVTISQVSSSKYVAISVRDNGIGMSPDERKQLFQRFYRIKNDKTKDISGTGLGLWIIKQYIDSMGGTIEVNSMQNAGSEFIVYLPKP